MPLVRLRQVFHSNGSYFTGVAILLTLLLLLLWRNPFSERTLIPNFEPFPDSFHYIAPVRSFLQGRGFFLFREGGGELKTSVPPLYSLVNVPALALASDPRGFYFTNVVLAFVSFFLFERITSVLFRSMNLRLVLLFAFVTTAPFSWVPTLAMAENLLLPLFLTACYLLVMPLSQRRAIVAGSLTWMLYGTKYAAAPQTVLFFMLYAAKIWLEAPKGERWVCLRTLALASVGSAIALFTFEQWHKGRTPLTSLAEIATAWISSKTAISGGRPNGGLNGFFSIEFLPLHWPQYFGGIFGNNQKFLAKQLQLLPQWVAVIGSVGLLLKLFNGPIAARRSAAAFFLFIAVQGTFMSTFYDVDLRFIYITFPLLLFGFGWALEWLWQRIPQRKWIPTITIAIVAAVLLIQSGIRLKQQIGLNLKYAETPWYYVAVKNMNDYFDSHPSRGEKPVVISPMDPYLIDFYSGGRYELLPLSEEQNHNVNDWDKIWGPNDYSDFVVLYRQYLARGRSLYVMKYGLGNQGALHADFQRLRENFKLELVQEGCYSLCDIYRVTL